MTNKVNLAAFSNSEYHSGKGILKRFLWFALSPVFINSYLPIPQVVKLCLLRLFGAKIGHGVVIKPKVNIKYPWLLTVGEFSWIGEKVWIDNLVPVKIGDNCCISQGAMLLTGNHNYKKSTFDLMTGEIILEQGVWVGAKATICPGVTMGTHSIASVGAILTKDTEPYSIYQGNPATKVKTRQILN